MPSPVRLRADVHGALEGGLEAARRDFAALRELRDRLRGVCPAGVTLDELSMGMSGDFPVAIEEGATIVRVGSALFEGISAIQAISVAFRSAKVAPLSERKATICQLIRL